MICAAETSTAPRIADRPTPPQPTTSTVDPGSTAAVLSTEQTPVVTAQPTSAATSSGRLRSMRMAPDSGTTACSPNVPSPPIDADRLVAAPEPRLAVAEEVVRARRELAQHVAAAQALRAGAAVRRPRQHHVVADLERRDAGAELLDDGGALVAEHLRMLPRPLALHDVEIAVADARGGHAHAHLARAGIGDPQALELQLATAVPHRRRDLFHAAPRVECPGAYDQRCGGDEQVVASRSSPCCRPTC